MSFRFSNSSIKKEPKKKSIEGIKNHIGEFKKKYSKKTTHFSLKNILRDDEDYYEINIISFKRSFSKLQGNYSLDH